MKAHETPRILCQGERTNPQEGRVVWSPVKSFWFISHALIAVIGGFLTFRYDAVLLSFVFFVTTMCLGSSIGFHRLLVHRSFECPRWLEAVFVYLGTVAGMGGPLGFLYMHDIRDWSQRHKSCHAYFTHQNPLWRDFIWQFFCDIRLAYPPQFQIEPRVATNRLYQFLERTWVLQQLPWAILFYALGGVSFVVWGIFVRITVSMLVLYLFGYFAHNSGSRAWHTPPPPHPPQLRPFPPLAGGGGAEPQQPPPPFPGGGFWGFPPQDPAGWGGAPSPPPPPPAGKINLPPALPEGPTPPAGHPNWRASQSTRPCVNRATN